MYGWCIGVIMGILWVYYNGLYILTYIGDYIGLYWGYVSHKPMLTYMIWCLIIKRPFSPQGGLFGCLGVCSPDIATPVSWEGMDKHPKKYLKTQTILKRYVLDVRKYHIWGPVFFFQIRSIFEGFLGIEVKLYEEILGCPGKEVRINDS